MTRYQTPVSRGASRVCRAPASFHNAAASLTMLITRRSTGIVNTPYGAVYGPLVSYRRKRWASPSLVTARCARARGGSIASRLLASALVAGTCARGGATSSAWRRKTQTPRCGALAPFITLYALRRLSPRALLDAHNAAYAVCGCLATTFHILPALASCVPHLRHPLCRAAHTAAAHAVPTLLAPAHLAREHAQPCRLHLPYTKGRLAADINDTGLLLRVPALNEATSSRSLALFVRVLRPRAPHAPAHEQARLRYAFPTRTSAALYAYTFAHSVAACGALLPPRN